MKYRSVGTGTGAEGNSRSTGSSRERSDGVQGRGTGSGWSGIRGIPWGHEGRGSIGTGVAAVPVTLGAAALTAALLLFPREGERPTPAGAEEVVDTFLIGRFILLAVMSLVFLGCLFLFLIYHLMEPVYAKPLHSS
ncbi:transmembrane protein 218 isoform X1 [Motacilla alba alba]|uniref:transmembrane protein 218 isoform X1 n=1 Tax=Motacilla alba alba TaxID=1094192 RepID=UPI0018D570F5|nr:transmembrane protein 218 isoform X1 [Motacilla alba alba]